MLRQRGEGNNWNLVRFSWHGRELPLARGRGRSSAEAAAKDEGQRQKQLCLFVCTYRTAAKGTTCAGLTTRRPVSDGGESQGSDGAPYRLHKYVVRPLRRESRNVMPDEETADGMDEAEKARAPTGVNGTCDADRETHVCQMASWCVGKTVVVKLVASCHFRWVVDVQVPEVINNRAGLRRL